MKIKLIDYGYENAPKRAHYNDAGADVYVCLKEDQKQIVIGPHRSIKIPLGFGLCLPDGYVAFICPRSGLSSEGITCELSPIDSGYRGEIHAIVTNCTDEYYIANNGDRIGQLVVMPCIMAEFVGELGDDRGNNGFGSSGK